MADGSVNTLPADRSAVWLLKHTHYGRSSEHVHMVTMPLGVKPAAPHPAKGGEWKRLP